MAPPRGTKRKSAAKPETLNLSGSQSPTLSPSEKKRSPSAASASGSGASPAPPRVGHARSFSSPASAKAKAKAKAASASSPAFSSGRGGGGGSGGGGWSAKHDGLDDFAFDKMSESEGDEDDDDAVAVPAPARARAGGHSGSGGGKGGASSAPKKNKALDSPSGKAKAAAAAAGTKKAKPATAPARKNAAAAAVTKRSSAPKAVRASGATAAAPRKRAGVKASRGSAKKEEVDVLDEDSENNGSANDDGDGKDDDDDDDYNDKDNSSDGQFDWGESPGSITAKKGKGRESNGGGSGGGGVKSGRGKTTPPAAPAAASRRRSSSSSGRVVTVGGKGSDVDLTQDEEEEGEGKGENHGDSASEQATPPSAPKSPKKKTGGKGKGSDVDLTQEEEQYQEEGEGEESERAGKGGSASKKAKKTTAAAAVVANGKQAAGASGKGKGKGKAKDKEGGSSRSSTMSSAKPTKLARDVGIVLRRLRKLRGEMARGDGGSGGGGAAGEDGAGGEKPPTLLELGLSGNVTEVREMDAAGVMDEIERIAVETALSIMEGKGFGFRVPTRSSGNQKYVEELDRIVLGDKVSHRNFVSTAMARKTAITTRVVELVHQVLGKGIHITKRDMFYTDVKLFKDQSESDNVLDDVACMVGCTRSCLNVVASDKGLVVGRVTFLEDGDLIDCTRMGVGGKAIPPYIDKITDIRSDADFILLVEKEAAYMRMAEDRFYQKYPCIVITAKGQPDVATRLFLKRLKRELNIPVMGLVDSDPYGLKILSVYMSGSKNMSYDSASLTTPDIKWLGVRPSDLDRYNIPEQCRLDMTEHDIKTGKELLQEDFIKKNEPWCRELELMIKSKKKAEIQSLSAFGFQYLTHTYLPQKLQNGDWV